MNSNSAVDIEIDEESYEIKAIKAYLAKEISISDLRASLNLKRSQTYRCGSACKKNPVGGVIGVQKGPLISMV